MSAPKRIALTGYSRSGKDEVGKVFIENGYERRAPGDIIKRQVDALVYEHFGFSAFTEEDSEKSRIRPLLEVWGEVNRDKVQGEFFGSLPERCVNTKLVRLPEALRWKKAGGVIWEVRRKGIEAATLWEFQQLEELTAAGVIDGVLWNRGSLADLRETVTETFF